VIVPPPARSASSARSATAPLMLARREAEDRRRFGSSRCTACRAPHRTPLIESMANAAALRLGIAAQMLASREALDEDVLVLPTHPAMRSAARYASTAEGLAPTATLGFSRTA
jgi:hypothetical protein